MTDGINQTMEHTYDISELAKALCIAQGQLDNAAKLNTNPHFRAKYADLTSVWGACRKPLSDNKLSIVQLPSAQGTKIIVKTMLIHESGQWIKNELSMTAQKDTPQAIGSAITYARRYALASMVGVTAEDDDGNAASQRASQPKLSPEEQRKQQLGSMIKVFFEFGWLENHLVDYVRKNDLSELTDKDIAIFKKLYSDFKNNRLDPNLIKASMYNGAEIDNEDEES